MLPSYASNSIFVVSWKDIIHRFSWAFKAGFKKSCCHKNASLLNFVFWQEQRRLLPRLARLLTSPSPLKHLVLKFPVKPYEGTLLMIGMRHPISSVFRLIWIYGWKTDPRLETERLDIGSFVVGSNKSLASQVGARGKVYPARWKLIMNSNQAKDLLKCTGNFISHVLANPDGYEQKVARLRAWQS